MAMVRNLLLATAFCIVPAVSMAAAAGAGASGAGVGVGAGADAGVGLGVGAPISGVGTVSPAGSPMPLSTPTGTIGTSPGGVTLVPGTVATPGVSGSGVTGTIPLAGTVGSPGVANLNPGLAPSSTGNSNALYPALQSQSALPSANQSTLPQVATCPAGVTHADGTC
jgi:hypothetical protein